MKSHNLPQPGCEPDERGTAGDGVGEGGRGENQLAESCPPTKTQTVINFHPRPITTKNYEHVTVNTAVDNQKRQCGKHLSSSRDTNHGLPQ